jgi:HNH endonuclease
MIEHTVDGCNCEGKRCSKCEETKCYGAFSPAKYGKLKLHSYCKVCKSAYQKMCAAGHLPKRQKQTEQERSEKVKTYSKEYYQDHAEERREYSRQYHQSHREECLGGMQRRYRRNINYHRAYARVVTKQRWLSNRKRWSENRRRYRQNNRERYQTRGKIYWHKNSERLNERAKVYRSRPEIRQRDTAHKREYARRNKARFAEARRAHCHTYRARKRSGGTYTVVEWKALRGRYSYTCLCCGKCEPDIKLTVDHVIPTIKHGRNVIENIQPLCLSCNTRKGAKIIDYRGSWKDDNSI